MKNKKAFTLVELIGVVVLLSILTLLIVPQVKGIIEKQKKKLYNEQLKIVLNSARQYVTDQEADTDVSKLGLMINISDLYDKGYLNKDKIIDPTTGKNFDKCVEAKWNNKFNQYEYVYDDDCELGTHRGCFAFNKSTQTIDSYYDYEYNDDTKPACPRAVEVPSIMDDVEVKKIGTRAFESKNITSVYLPNTITTINEYAFQKNKIEQLEMFDSITKIGSYAFNYNKLKKLELPDSIITMDVNAFQNNLLTDVKISSGLTYIANGAFRNNKLTHVEIPNNILVIGWGAFQTNQIQTVTLPKYLQTIDSCAFSGNQLSEISFPETLTSIGNDAFNANHLTNLVIPDSVTTIGSGAFAGNRLVSVKLSKNLTAISANVLSSNYLTEIDIPKTATIIDGGAFRNNLLESVEIPSSVTKIGGQAFYGNKLTNVKFNIGLKIIEGSAFTYNPSITDLILPEGLEEIGMLAFRDDHIKNVVFPNTLKKIDSQAFYQNELTSINLPSSLTTMGGGIFSWNKVPMENAYIYGHDSNGNEDRSVLNSYATTSNKNIVIPNGVKVIQDYAFDSMIISNLLLPAGLEKIGYRAFYWNTVHNIDLPNTVTYIGAFAFAYGGAGDIKIPDSVTYLGDHAFYSTRVKSLKLGTGLNSIYSETFKCDTLITVEIPSNVVSIAENAFKDSVKKINVNNNYGVIGNSPWGATKAVISYNDGTYASSNTLRVLDYIQGDGLSYINTEFKANNNTSVEENISLNALDTTQSLYCSRTETKTDRYCAFQIANSGIRTDYNLNAKTVLTPTELNIKYKIYQDKNNFYINDTLLKTWDEGTFQATGSMYLFSSYATPYDTISNYGTFNLYSTKIWDNGTLVRDMIPVKTGDGSIGMYDKVEGKIYKNAGTGSFIAGPTI